MFDLKAILLAEMSEAALAGHIARVTDAATAMRVITVLMERGLIPAALHEGVARIPIADRGAAVWAFRAEGLRVKAIAARMGISVALVTQALFAERRARGIPKNLASVERCRHMQKVVAARRLQGLKAVAS